MIADTCFILMFIYHVLNNYGIFWVKFWHSMLAVLTESSDLIYKKHQDNIIQRNTLSFLVNYNSSVTFVYNKVYPTPNVIFDF